MRLLSLFSGIGAFEKALTNLNIDYELVGFSEIDKWAIKSYCAIHNISEDLNLGDISKIKDEDIPNADLVTYGFPCQDISVAGLQKGIKEGTRSGLLYEAERVIKTIKPRYAIAENVKNLVGKKHKNDFDELLKRLDAYGYNNYWKVLNAKDFGIPQNRERVFIISIRKDIDVGVFKFPDKIEIKSLNFRDFLTKNALYLEEKDYNKVKGLGAEYNFGGRVAKQNEKIYGTITANYGKVSGNSMKFEENNKYRYLNTLECWRLMGFSDKDYNEVKKLKHSENQMYKQAGNSICVNVLEGIFKKLFEVQE